MLKTVKSDFMNIELIERAKKFYTEIVENELNIVFEKEMQLRFRQLESMCEVLKNNFDKTPINFLETGTSQNFRDACFGIFFGFLVRETNGKFYTVDINGDKIEKSKKLFEKYLPNLNGKFYTQDSVSFCKNTQMTFNLIHLDSWDFELTDPFPSTLHGWREFETLQYKTEDGGIIFVDDNYLQGTKIPWIILNNKNGEIMHQETINVKYPIVGKGAHVYQYAQTNQNWEILGNHYNIGENIKVIVKKNWKE